MTEGFKSPAAPESSVRTDVWSRYQQELEETVYEIVGTPADVSDVRNENGATHPRNGGPSTEGVAQDPATQLTDTVQD